MEQNYATAFNSGQMGIDLSNRMSNIKLDTEVDPAEIQALVNKYTKIEENKGANLAPTAADTFQPQGGMANAAQNLTTYQPSAPVINQGNDFQYHQGYMPTPQPSVCSTTQNVMGQIPQYQQAPQYTQLAQAQMPPVQYAPSANDVTSSYSSNSLQQPTAQAPAAQGFSTNV